MSYVINLVSEVPVSRFCPKDEVLLPVFNIFTVNVTPENIFFCLVQLKL